MRPFSFRSQLLLLMVVPVLVTTAVLGWLAYGAASEALTRGAVQAVRIAANAGEQALLMRLRRQHERASGFLEVAASNCAASKGPERARCLQDTLADFVATEGVRGARLVAPGLESIRVGERAKALEDLAPLPPGQWVRIEPKQGDERFYDILVQGGGMTLGLRFSAAAQLDPLFQEQYGLGRSGETFLADAQGVFLTEPMYPGHSGESQSHPIDARPMRECLSGRSAEMLAPDYRGVDVIHGFRFIEEIGGGCIMAHIEQAEAFAPARALRARLAEVAAALATLAVGLSVVFARRFSRPVSRLTDRARALQSGDFDIAVPDEGPRELKAFAETFTKMAHSLQESNEERARLLARETEARREAEAQKALLRLIIEQSGDAILMADEHGVMRVFNPAAECLHGVTPREVEAAEWAGTYSLLSLEGQPLPLEATPLYRAVRGEVVAEARWLVRRPDGQVRVLEGTATPLRKPDGAPAGGALIARDITHQREAEVERERLLREVQAERTRLEVLAGLSRALAESRLTLEAVLDTTCHQLAERVGDVCILRLVSPDGQWLEARATYARDAAVEARVRALLEHWSQRSTEGASARVLASGEPLLLPVVPREFLEHYRAMLPPEYRDSLTRDEPYSLALLPVRSLGRIIGVLALYRLAPGSAYTEDDLILFRESADRAALAIENARLFQQAQEAARIREDLVAVVSHDLRNPISAISMSASVMLKREGLQDWQAKGLSRIYSAADRAIRLIRDLLDSTQARVGGIPVEPRPLDFHELVRHVVEEVQLAHPERHIFFQPGGDAHGAWDADRMAQVITNLVGNAVQHSPAGTPVRVSSRGEDGEVLLEVHNEGPPIPAEVLPTLFEPFRRGRSAGGGAVGSVGLGLFISRQLVEAHGGSIEVRSTQGEGTTFTVRFRRAVPR
ncbi:ATP-binding protein [Archangium sp.]|uniref:ATP-binding protein n=1 Tax=Archangium sp. TaxID=1872627 RepID=UPI002D4F98B6|nr:ATP-binding protein [Archangium sp.]HYO59603.1 ATP-binding protein [Archangium sp.]